jgi:uncharacterized membrane protein YebE (DUF533 family)
MGHQPKGSDDQTAQGNNHSAMNRNATCKTHQGGGGIAAVLFGNKTNQTNFLHCLLKDSIMGILIDFQAND